MDKRTKDRKNRELFLPVRERVLEVQQAFLEFQQQQFQLDRQHVAEIDELSAKHAKEIDDINAKVRELQAQLDAYKARPKAEYSKQTQTRFDPETGLHYCVVCWEKPTSGCPPMRDIETGWMCLECKLKYPDMDRPPKVTGPIEPSPTRHRQQFLRR